MCDAVLNLSWCIFFSGGAEGESNDRNTMELPGHQHDLLFDAAVKSESMSSMLVPRCSFVHRQLCFVLSRFVCRIVVNFNRKMLHRS